jgi:hypothetical protein
MANAIPAASPNHPSWVLVSCVVVPLLVLVSAAFAPVGGGLRLILTAALLAVFLLVLGVAISGRPLGVIINQRNLMSLSALQSVMWTVIVVAAYATMALTRVREGISDPLAIQVPTQLWMLLGISATALVGTPLILSTKTQKIPDPKRIEATAQALKTETSHEIDKNRIGTLYSNASIADAQFTDIFQGDEVGNTAHIDLAKVQMFFFTLLIALSYFAATVALIGGGNTNSLPQLEQGAVALLGISQGGYLLSKTADYSGGQ